MLQGTHIQEPTYQFMKLSKVCVSSVLVSKVTFLHLFIELFHKSR